MRLLSLVVTNLVRHRLRASIGVAGIAFGVAAMLTILALVRGAIGMFEHILTTDSDYVVFEKNVSDLFFSSVPKAEVEQIAALSTVAESHANLIGIVSSPGYPVITCFGLEATDPRLSQGTWIAGTRERFGAEPNGVVLGSRAAGFLGANPGGNVAIGAKVLRVDGVLKAPNGFEDGGVFMPIGEAQAYFHRAGMASVVAVRLRNPGSGAEFEAAVSKSFPGLVAMKDREFSSTYNSFRILRATSWGVGICVFVLGGLGVANTMLLSVFSRIREIAILRVCGFSSFQVALLILLESAVLALAGLVIGGIIGGLALELLPRVPAFQGYLQASVAPASIIGVIALAIVTAGLGALYPALFAAKIQPAEALRYE